MTSQGHVIGLGLLMAWPTTIAQFIPPQSGSLHSPSSQASCRSPQGVCSRDVRSPFSIETLMSVAAIGALVIGEAEEAAAVVFLFAVGELLERLKAGRARAGIKALRRWCKDRNSA